MVITCDGTNQPLLSQNHYFPPHLFHLNIDTLWSRFLLDQVDPTVHQGCYPLHPGPETVFFTGNPLFVVFWLVIASTKKALEGFPNLFLESECIWQFRHFIENCLWQGGAPRLTLYYRTSLFWTKIQLQFSYVWQIVDKVKMFLWFKKILSITNI